MSKAYLTGIGNGAGNAECLKSLADGCRSVCRSLAAFFDGNGRAYGVSPFCIFKADGLNALYHLIYIQAGRLRNLAGLFDGTNSILLQNSKNLFLSSLI